MSKTAGELHKQLGDWFKQPVPGLIPKAGMDFSDQEIEAYRHFFDPSAEQTRLSHRPDGCQYKYDDTPGCDIMCDVVNLPLIVAIQSGISGQILADIAKHHEINLESLLDTVDSLIVTGHPFHGSGGKVIPQSRLMIESFKAVSMAFPDAVRDTLVSMKLPSVHLNLASLHSEDPSHWPAARLSAHMKAMEAGAEDIGSLDKNYFAMNDISRDYIFDGYLPRDESGPRYDLYLERSGMLLPEVISKKIHPMTLWEDLVWRATVNTGYGPSGLLNYCIDHAPERFKPSIEKALKSMVANTHDFFRATYWHYNFLSDRLKGTWLESHMNAPRLLVNLVSNDDFEQVLAKLRELDPNHAYNAQVFSDRVKAPNTLDQWLDEVMTTEPKDLTLSHFQIYHLERYELPEQILSTRWRPEAVIRHMLKGLELFVTQDCEQNLPKRQIDEQAFQGCVYVAKTLVSRYELDYKAFAGFGSLSVRALAEAGLDKRRLPRMNNRDKGILVLEEMGL